MRQYRLTEEQMSAALAQIKATIGNTPEVQAEIRRCFAPVDGELTIIIDRPYAWAPAIVAHGTEMK